MRNASSLSSIFLHAALSSSTVSNSYKASALMYLGKTFFRIILTLVCSAKCSGSLENKSSISAKNLTMGSAVCCLRFRITSNSSSPFWDGSKASRNVLTNWFQLSKCLLLNHFNAKSQSRSDIWFRTSSCPTRLECIRSVTSWRNSAAEPSPEYERPHLKICSRL